MADNVQHLQDHVPEAVTPKQECGVKRGRKGSTLEWRFSAVTACDTDGCNGKKTAVGEGLLKARASTDGIGKRSKKATVRYDPWEGKAQTLAAIDVGGKRGKKGLAGRGEVGNATGIASAGKRCTKDEQEEVTRWEESARDVGLLVSRVGRKRQRDPFSKASGGEHGADGVRRSLGGRSRYSASKLLDGF